MSRFVLSPVVAGIMRLPTWQWSSQQVATWVSQCLEHGIDCFDSADIYGGYTAERLFGEGLKLLAPSVRAKVKVITKCGIQLISPERPQHLIKSYNNSIDHIERSLNRSLMDLHLEQAYALLIHRPDHLSEPLDTANIIDQLKKQGKLAHFGLSNHSNEELRIYSQLTTVSTHQIEWSPLHLEPLYNDALKCCQSLKVTPMIWSPLAGGKAFDSSHPPVAAWLHSFNALADSLDLTPLSLLTAWMCRHPAKPVPVLGSQQIDRLNEAIKGTQASLTAEQWYQILRLFKGKDVP